MTIIIGTASSMPHTFQSEPQKISPTKIATAFMRAARLLSHGVSRKPSRLVITSDTIATVAAMRRFPNWRKRDDRDAAGDDDGTEVGDRVEDAGQQAPQRRLLDAKPEEGQPRRDADDRAREELHEEKRLDLPVDVIEDLHGDSFARQRWPGDLHELAAIEIPGRKQEEHQKENEHQLSQRRRDAERSPHQVLA